MVMKLRERARLEMEAAVMEGEIMNAQARARSRANIGTSTSTRVSMGMYKRSHTSEESKAFRELLDAHHEDVIRANEHGEKSGIEHGHLEVDLIQKAAKALYLTTVCLGDAAAAQCFPVVLDTGSTNFWVITNQCNRFECNSNGKRKYNFAADVKFHWYDSEGNGEKHGKPFSVQFGTGSIEGYLARTSVYFGDTETGILLPNQDFGAIDSESGGVFSGGYFSGVLGCAYKAMAIYNHNPVIDRIFEDDDRWEKSFNHFKVFSFYMNEKAGQSKFVLGEPDPSLYTGDISWVAVTKKYYWEAKLHNVYVNGKSVACANQGCKVVFDSGTMLQAAPSSVLSTLLNAARAGGCPSITYTLETTEGTLKNFSLGPEHILNDYEGSESHNCDKYTSVKYMAMDVAPPRALFG